VGVKWPRLEVNYILPSSATIRLRISVAVPLLPLHAFMAWMRTTLLFIYLTKRVNRLAQSVQQLATGWTVRGSNPGGARFSAPFQTGPGAHPASYTMGTGSFRGVNRPGRGVDHPPQSSAKDKERVELYIYSPPPGPS